MSISIAYWCVLAAALLPYVWVAIAKRATRGYDNRDPRGSVARQQDPRVHRAYAAHLNSFEAFPAFAAGVVIAQLAGVPDARVAALAVAFVVLRVLYGLCYLGDRALARSLAWAGGLACSVALLALAARQAATLAS
ncbi:MAG TPA: MAPEG family protein [Lysobacter sp.]